MKNDLLLFGFDHAICFNIYHDASVFQQFAPKTWVVTIGKRSVLSGSFTFLLMENIKSFGNYYSLLFTLSVAAFLC